jgi:hypothetical protein
MQDARKQEENPNSTKIFGGGIGFFTKMPSQKKASTSTQLIDKV